jgi:hypothetical protein
VPLALPLTRLSGIHNEPGILKRKLPPAKELITQMLGYITDTDDAERAFLPFKHDGKDRVVLLVNNLGGVSELELGLIVQQTLAVLEGQNIQVERVNAGSFMVCAPIFSWWSKLNLCIDFVQPPRFQFDTASPSPRRGQAQVLGRAYPPAAGRTCICSRVETVHKGCQGGRGVH